MIRPVFRTAAACAFALAVSAAGFAQDTAMPPLDPPPAGEYRLDPAHASLVFRVNHIGFSNYTMRFTRFDVDLDFDPAAPESMTVTAQIDAASLETDYPGDDIDFDAELTGPNWLDTAEHPAIRFVSTDVEPTGENTAVVTGTLSLMGVERPIELDVRFNGGYAGMPGYDPQARIGFSATAQFDRSDFGFVHGLPAEGTDIGVGDTVSVQIEAELLGPALAAAAEN